MAKFKKVNTGKEIYFKDQQGNEIYRKSKHWPFAKDAYGIPYYAKDKNKNEYYPVRDNKSLFIVDPITGEEKIALYADKTERYPVDKYGNEYYLKRNGEPYLLQDKNGQLYLAKTRRGNILIPWNCMEKFINDQPHIYGKDAAGNSIYINKSDIPQMWQSLIRCICHLSVICPKFKSCITVL